MFVKDFFELPNGKTGYMMAVSSNTQPSFWLKLRMVFKGWYWLSPSNTPMTIGFHMTVND